MNVLETLAERDKTYGCFSTGSKISQYLKGSKSLNPNTELTPSQAEALDMIFSKISRILNGDASYIDTWHDICGYAQLIEAELIEKDLKNEV